MEAKKNKSGKWTIYEVDGSTLRELAEAVTKLYKVAEEAGFKMKGGWLAEEALSEWEKRKTENENP